MLAAMPLSGAAFGQQSDEQQETFFESIEVNIVTVDVVVTDKKGRPATGLTADDFAIYEDGEQVDITNFFTVGGGGALPTASATTEATASGGQSAASTTAVESSPLRLVAFVDGLHLTPQGRNQLLPAFRDFIEEGSIDKVMIVGFDSELKIHQDFTTNADAMLGSLDQVASSASRGTEAAMEFRRIIQELSEGDGDGPGGGGFTVSNVESIARAQLSGISLFARNRHAENLRSIAALKETIAWLSAIPGRKAMIYIGEGLTVRPGEALLDAWTNRWQNNPSVSISSFQDVLQYDLGSELRELADFANANRVTIYAVGAENSLKRASSVEFAGLAANGGRVWSPAMEAAELGNLRESLTLMSEPTGGASRVTNFGALLDQVQSDFDSFYSLAYSPSRSRDDQRHKIRVEIKRPDLRLRYRDQYRDKADIERMEDRTKSALLLADNDNPLEVDIDFGAHGVEEDGKLLLPVIIKIPMSKLTLLPHQRFHEGKVSIYLGTRDDKGRVSGVQKTDVPIRIPNEQLLATLGQLGGYSVTLRIRPIDHTVAVAVRDEIGHIDSAVSLRFEPEA